MSEERVKNTYEGTWNFALDQLDSLRVHHKESAIHTNRVMLTAITAGEKAGLSKDEIYLLLVSAALHDIGKRDVDANLLLKSHPSDDDINIIRHDHISGTRDRIKKSNIEPIIKDQILAVVMLHHEIYPGNGNHPYPRNSDGINGEREKRVNGFTHSKLARILALSDIADRAVFGFNNGKSANPNTDDLAQRLRNFIRIENHMDDGVLIDDVAEACNKLWGPKEIRLDQ